MDSHRPYMEDFNTTSSAIVHLMTNEERCRRSIARHSLCPCCFAAVESDWLYLVLTLADSLCFNTMAIMEDYKIHGLDYTSSIADALH
ncbi:hypothetical protein V6N13_029273 [Hibiscus sabdariffa]|uniref:Uncharacterized protein n=1 Tax=Hibiscus sabdariffa TaxID=183260 RepID=A0ABR2BX16_9ROSI